MVAAIVLAGGLGTRLRAAVPDLPKPMAPVAGRPFLEHQLDHWIGQGVQRFVLSVGYRSEAIRAHFGGAYRGVPIDYAVEAAPLGTGGGVLLGAALLPPGESFLLLNGDTFFDVALDRLRAFHRANAASLTFSLFRTTETGRYMGMDVNGDGRIAALRSGSASPGRLANGGVYWVDPAALRDLPWKPGDRLSFEDDLVPAVLAGGGRLYGLECAGRFIDIGIPGDYRRAASVLTAVPSVEEL